MTLKDWLKKYITGPHRIVALFLIAVWSVFAVRSFVVVQTKEITYTKQTADLISMSLSQHNRVMSESILETLLSQGGAVGAEICDGNTQIIGSNQGMESCSQGAGFLENIIIQKIPGSGSLVLRSRFDMKKSLASTFGGLGFALILVFCGFFFIQTIQNRIIDDLFDPLMNELLGTDKLKITEMSAIRKKVNEAKDVEAQRAVAFAIQENNQQVAHDIRGPIQSIGALLKMTKIEDPELKSAFEKAVARASSVANGLLESEAAPEENIKSTSYDISSLVTELVKEKRPLFSGGRIDIADLESLAIETALGSAALSRILSNVIDNSILACDHDKRIKVDLSTDSTQVVITIKDHGCGIDASSLVRVGEKGFSNRKHARDHGTGRGIYSARSVLAEVGGSLEINSAPLVGTVVRITFPIRKLTSEVDLVFIDDDTLQRKSWSIWARQNGLALRSFSSAEEFISNASSVPRGVPVFIDVELGDGISGPELAKLLREDGFENLVFATAHRSLRGSEESKLHPVISKDPASALLYLKTPRNSLKTISVDFA